MSNDLEEIEDEAIFADTSEIIKQALKKAHSKSSAKTNIAKTAFQIALDQLV